MEGVDLVDHSSSPELARMPNPEERSKMRKLESTEKRTEMALAVQRTKILHPALNAQASGAPNNEASSEKDSVY